MTVGTVFIASASGFLHVGCVDPPCVQPGGGRDEYGPYWVPMEGNSLKGWEPILPYESARAWDCLCRATPEATFGGDTKIYN